MDPRVIPLVEYFNKIGLHTSQSCEGHPGTSMKFFWIEFDRVVTEEMIIEFQKKHTRRDFGFCSNGMFCKRFFYDDDGKDVISSYRYVAHSPDDADKDLTQWLTEDEFGVEGW